MTIIQYLNLTAEQYRMSDCPEDKLDQLVMHVLDKMEMMSPDDLEHVQAAALPFGMEKNEMDHCRK